MTMALRGRLFSNDDATTWEIVEIYRESMRRRIAAVKLPRKKDWSGSEVCFFLPEEALSGMVAP